MFSGIIEAKASIKRARREGDLVRIEVARPAEFSDLKLGDSVATNGVCLTVEQVSDDDIRFALGPETLKVTGWSPRTGEFVNLERSLKLGDRIHGHFVAGHVDAVGRVEHVVDQSELRTIRIRVPHEFAVFVWRKGSVAINGVSLTINDADQNEFSVGLIPETLKRTNLGELRQGDIVNLEADAMARAWFHWRNLK